MTTNLEELKRLALAAPEVVFDNETESGRFYNAATPQQILSLISDLETCIEALKKIASMKTIGVVAETQAAREALSKIKVVEK